MHTLEIINIGFFIYYHYLLLCINFMRFPDFSPHLLATQADGGQVLDRSRDVFMSVYVDCLETSSFLLLSHSKHDRQTSTPLLSLRLSPSHTFPRPSSLCLTMIFASSTPNYSLTLIEFLAEGEGGDVRALS